jgi:hypothetical protein
MPDLLARRKQDLQEQFDTLPRELDNWKSLSQQPAYEKHHSQIVALSKQMLELNDRVKQAWNGSEEFVAIQKAQRDCAAVHTVWNFFRQKLLMRSDRQLGSYLRAADAYVWACYEPVLIDRRARDTSQPFREPPLVTFDSDLSAWALSREQELEPEDDKTGATRGALFVKALTAMPIAVLGIPWYTSELLPNLATLAHETGHVIDSDFGVGESLKTALATALQASSLCDGWSLHWRREVFADLFACYAAGPPFVWALADSIPDSPGRVKTLQRPSNDEWGLYPPASLRILLNLEALRHLGHAAEADRIQAYWTADYTEHAMGAYLADLKPVVTAVYAAAALPRQLNYADLTDQQGRIFRQAVTLNSDLNLKDPYNPRSLVGAASQIHRTSTVNADKAIVWQRLQRHMVEARLPGLLDSQRERTTSGAGVPLRTEELAELMFGNTPPDDAATTEPR